LVEENTAEHPVRIKLKKTDIRKGTSIR
jgi:hypothetical protein